MAEVLRFTRVEEKVEKAEQERLRQILTNLIEAVERGHVTAMAIATTGPNGEYMITPPARDVMLLMGCVEMMKQGMLDRLRGDSVVY
jgi:hypothetical protein